MKERKRFKPQPRRVNFVFLDGGVGDHIASLVAMDYVLKNYNWITPLIWTPDYLVDFAKHVLPKNTNVGSYTLMKEKYNPAMTTKTTKWDGVFSPMKIHILDYAFLKLTDENPSIEHKNYLKIKPDLIDVSMFNLPKRYVVMTAGYTAKVREFPAKAINEIMVYLKQKECEPVFLGQTKTITGAKHIIEGNFDKNINFKDSINLLDKTTLLEAAKIMSNAKAVVGVDNGLLHVAGCTDVPIVGGFTTVKPEIRMPVRNNILGHNFYPVTEAKSDCNFCQQTTNFLYGHDYRNCLYKKDDECINRMSSDKFIAELQKIL